MTLDGQFELYTNDNYCILFTANGSNSVNVDVKICYDGDEGQENMITVHAGFGTLNITHFEYYNCV